MDLCLCVDGLVLTAMPSMMGMLWSMKEGSSVYSEVDSYAVEMLEWGIAGGIC